MEIIYIKICDVFSLTEKCFRSTAIEEQFMNFNNIYLVEAM